MFKEMDEKNFSHGGGEKPRVGRLATLSLQGYPCRGFINRDLSLSEEPPFLSNEKSRNLSTTQTDSCLRSKSDTERKRSCIALHCHFTTVWRALNRATVAAFNRCKTLVLKSCRVRRCSVNILIIFGNLMYSYCDSD